MPRRILFHLFIFIATLLVTVPVFAHASATDGTIDSTNKFAWGNDLGWVNFGTTGGNVQITSAGLTGYAWSANYGWINLAPAGAGVSNTCTGALSGYGWGENVGYVNFGGVFINASGKFTGTAVVVGGVGSGGTSLGSVDFDCTNCSVVTDWRYCTNGGGGGSGGGAGGTGGGGGGGGGTGYYSPPGSTSSPSGSSATPPSSYCAGRYAIGDFNCDGRVNLVDLSIFLYYYGRSDSGIARYDLNHNGTVDFPDVSILMYHWTG